MKKLKKIKTKKSFFLPKSKKLLVKLYQRYNEEAILNLLAIEGKEEGNRY